MNSLPFNEEKYNELMGRLEAAEIAYGALNSDSRMDSEYYKTCYTNNTALLASKEHFVLADIIKEPVRTGHTPSMAVPAFYGGEVNFIKTDNLRENYILDSFNHKLSENGNRQLKLTQLKNNDIIATIIGATHAIIGRTCLVSPDILPANINQNIALIRANPAYIEPEVLTIYINCKYGKMHLHHLARQTEQVNMNCREVERLIVPKFTTCFQKCIREIVCAAYAIKMKTRMQYAAAQDLLLSELGLSDFDPSSTNVAVKTFSGSFGKSGRLDAEYYQPKYDEIEARITSYPNGCSVIKDKFRQNKQIYAIGSDIEHNYIEIGDVDTSSGTAVFNRVTTDALPANAKIDLNKGDVIYSTVRPYRGAVAICEFDKKIVVSGAFTVLQEKTNYLKECLFVLLRTKVYQEYIMRFNVGSSYPVVKDEDVLNLKLPNIPDDMQCQIAEKVQQSFDLRKRSAALLEYAKQAVEMAIEKDEETAMAFLAEMEG